MQPVDLSRLSLADFESKSCRSPRVFTVRKARSDVVDGLRTVYWCRRLENLTGIRTARGLEKQFEPESFRRLECGELVRKKKWDGYRVGRHVPMPKLVDRIEAKYPGLRWELNHVLWELLSANPKTINIEQFLSQLEDPVRGVIQRRINTKGGIKGLKFSRGFGNYLLRNANLDTLAFVVFSFQITIRSDNFDEAIEWMREIYRQLVVLGYHLIKCGIANPIFELIVLRVIGQFPNGRKYYWLPSPMYLEIVGHLLGVMWHLEGKPYGKMTMKVRYKEMARILCGDYGLDLLFAFNPILLDPADAADSSTRFDWFKWGIKSASNSIPKSTPPESLPFFLRPISLTSL